MKSNIVHFLVRFLGFFLVFFIIRYVFSKMDGIKMEKFLFLCLFLWSGISSLYLMAESYYLLAKKRKTKGFISLGVAIITIIHTLLALRMFIEVYFMLG
ncbi:hypothetical protein [Capnocytophaga stomatis]|uniref:Uncharacterized protein n=1 Tax=Capnocytophaga stomatis TaxID=1848904 RepID=A0ABW8QCJ6_9FLAO|nr:hypothetical protein [Capnocytophaga stomatis]